MRKSWVLFLCFAASVFAVVACGKNVHSGLMGAGKVKLTETPTPTPDVNFTVYIHQEKTPVDNINMSIRSMLTGATLTAKTGPDGLAGFEVHSGGQWNLQVDTFNGFKSQGFTVEPLSNTFYAVNYGIPSLDLELVSGSETIGIAPSTIVYKVIYHTYFEREEKVKIDKYGLLNVTYSSPSIVRNEGDSITCTINIPKSYEGYDFENQYLVFRAVCEDYTGKNTESNQRCLTKGWKFNVDVDFHYIQMYDSNDNNRQVIYWAGIRNVDVSKSSGIPFAGSMNYEVLDADNAGTDVKKTLIHPVLNALPDWVGYASYQALIKIPTSGNLVSLGDYRSVFKNNNNGWIKVRFYDNASLGGVFDVTRTFTTEQPWGQVCLHWSCAYSTVELYRDNYQCLYNTNDHYGNCLFGATVRAADMFRRRVERINITK